MPIGSIIGGLIGQGGANASGAAAGRSGTQAWQNALQLAGANKSVASPYLLAGWAGTNQLLKAYGLGHLNPMNVDGGPNSTAYGETSLDNSNVAGDRANALSEFQASPGFQFRRDQGVQALDRSAASKGMLLSGAQKQGVTEYGQKAASDEWGNYTNALRGLSGQGASSAAAVNGADTSAGNAGNALEFQGNMGQASQYANAANALASGIGKGVQNLFSLFSPKLSGV